MRHIALKISRQLPLKVTRASEIFERYAAKIENGDVLLAALAAPNIWFIETVDQSKAINRIRGYFIVIAASGMCDAGRIRHHLKAHLRWVACAVCYRQTSRISIGTTSFHACCLTSTKPSATRLMGEAKQL